jgi:hypothetical protein
MALQRKVPLTRKTPLPKGVTPIARGAELKAGKALAKSKSAHPGGSGLRRTPLAKRSAKTAEVYAMERSPAVRQAIEDNRPCEVGEILGVAGFDAASWVCREWPRRGSEGWGFHHRRKASAGGSNRIGPNALWCCPNCNEAVEEYPADVRALTGSQLVVREGDPEWPVLGRRGDAS